MGFGEIKSPYLPCLFEGFCHFYEKLIFVCIDANFMNLLFNFYD